MAQVFANAIDGRSFEARLADAKGYVVARDFAAGIYDSLRKIDDQIEAAGANSMSMCVFGPIRNILLNEYDAAIRNMMAQPDYREGE